MDLTVEEKIIKAKVQINMNNPFFSYLLTGLNIQPMPEKYKGMCDTICVNKFGDTYYNPKFIDKLSVDEIKGVLCHELLHCVYGHVFMNPAGYNKEILNISQDIIINNDLVSEKFKLPVEGIIPEKNSVKLPTQKGVITINDINTKTSYDIYSELEKNLPKQKGFDTILYDDSNNENNKSNQISDDILKEKWKQKLVSAAEYSIQNRGTIPDSIQQVINELLNPQISWSEYLMKYVSRILPNDYTYTRPNKRSISCGCYMPSVVKEKLYIVASIDTSGSMSDEDLTLAVSELKAIAGLSPNIEIDVIICDADIHDTIKLNSTDLSKLKMKGGGGTSHIPVYNYVNDKLKNTKVLINFTDGYTEFPEEKNKGMYDSFWVMTNEDKHSVPFGKVLQLHPPKRRE